MDGNGGISQSSFEFLLNHCAEETRGGIRWFSESLRSRKILCIRGAKNYSSMKFICRKVRKEIRSQTHMCFKKRWHQKFSCIEAEVSRTFFELFRLPVPKKSF